MTGESALIKAIGFDLGGVILPGTLHGGVAHLAQKLDMAGELIDDAIWAQRSELEVAAINETDYWQNVADRLGSSQPGSQLEAWWIEGYIKRNPVATAMMKLVERLKSQGYEVGLLSNIDLDHATLNRSRHVFEPFDVVLLSNELQYRKPDPRAYQALADALAVEYYELVFVDDLTGNIAAANELGIHGLVFTSYAKLIKDLRALDIAV